MKARLFNVRSNKKDVPFIYLKGKWLDRIGFCRNSRIIVCYEEYGKLTILNADTVTHKALEEEHQRQIHIIG